MECKKIQEWLITDHLDGELGPVESAEVQSHMKECGACQDFMLAVQGTAGVPFKGIVALRPDPIVWRRVRGIIEADAARSRGGWFRNIEQSLSLRLQPMPLLRVAFLAVVFLAVAVLARWPISSMEPAYAYVEEQMMFVEELQSGDPEVTNGDIPEYALPFE